MEHDLDALIALNPITGNTDKLSFRLADQAEMKLLHMVTASPARTPSLTMFGDDDYFFSNDTTNANVPCTSSPTCIFVPVSPAATFAWNHGDVQEDITRTWVAMVGPGVRKIWAQTMRCSQTTLTCVPPCWRFWVLRTPMSTTVVF